MEMQKTKKTHQIIMKDLEFWKLKRVPAALKISTWEEAGVQVQGQSGLQSQMLTQEKKELWMNMAKIYALKWNEFSKSNICLSVHTCTLFSKVEKHHEVILIFTQRNEVIIGVKTTHQENNSLQSEKGV